MLQPLAATSVLNFNDKRENTFYYNCLNKQIKNA